MAVCVRVYVCECVCVYVCVRVDWRREYLLLHVATSTHPLWSRMPHEKESSSSWGLGLGLDRSHAS
jgi:hypothetical protein